MFTEINEKIDKNGNPLLPFVVYTIGASIGMQEAISRPTGSVPNHLIWVTEGAGVFWVKDHEMTLEAGEGLLCRSNVPHGYKSTGVFKTKWLTFFGGENLLDYCGIKDYRFFQMPDTCEKSADLLYDLCCGNSTIISRSAAGYSWMTEFLAEIVTPTLKPEQILRQYMEVHYKEDLTLEKLAAQVHMTKYALCHYYTRTQGMTVMEQLRQIRIAKAKLLMRFSSYPIAEIGHMCGYDSASYFGKHFKEETGVSPREYRKQICQPISH